MDHHDEAFLKKAAEAKQRIQEVSPQAVDGLRQEGVLILDVREHAEHQSGHVEGALHLNLNAFAESIASIVPDKSAAIVCYCNGGNRGALAADQLLNMGYANVKSIAGGFRAYTSAKSRTIQAQDVNPDTTLVFDVRREADYAASNETIPGAMWKNPEKIDIWVNALPRTLDVIIYCVRGGGVSSSVVDRLQAEGVKARFIEGGIEAYKAAGGKVTAIETASSLSDLKEIGCKSA